MKIPAIRMFQRMPSALLATAALLATPFALAADHVPDPAYNGGLISPDAFAGSSTNDYIGRKLVRLENGDVVIAGKVPPLSGNANFGALGLVRRNAAGQRVAWSNPGAHGHYNNEYVVLPPHTAGATTTYTEEVRDLIVHGDLLLVLVDTRTSTGFLQVNIYVFGTDGSYRSSSHVDGEFSSEGTRETWGGGLAAYSQMTLPAPDPTVLYVGRKKVGSMERITFRRFSVSSAGVLTSQTALAHPNIPDCSAGVHCSAYGISLGGRTAGLGPPRVYITGGRYQECPGAICWTGWWAYVVQISPTDGAQTGTGFRYMTPGRGRALAVEARGMLTSSEDDIYVLAERDRTCQNGMVVSALRQDAPIAWSTVIGGADGSICIVGQFAPRTVVPTAIALQDGRLAVAGHGHASAGCTGLGCEDIVDGAIAVLNANDGSLVSPAAASGNPQPLYYPFRDTVSGPRRRHSGFHDIVGSGNGSFTVAGDVRYPDSDEFSPTVRGKMQFASLRVLDPAGSGGLFSDGFEGGGTTPGNAVAAIVIDKNVTVASMVSDRFTWRDSANRPRSAVLAHNNGQTGPQGAGSGYANRGGALRQLSYQLPNGSTRTANVTTSGNAGQGGFGYVVSHASSQDHCTAPDDSPLGYAFPGTFVRVFEGKHHAVFRFTQNYPRRCTAAAPAQAYDVPVTIEWTFATGRDHPLWSVTYNVSGIPADRLKDDSRAPYGELLFDGAASEGAHAQIAGVAWGDRYTFTTTQAPVTTGSAWTWNQPNAIPYVKLWTTTPDATMGIVQSQSIERQDAGGYWGVNRWNTTSASGLGCTTAPSNTHAMPCPWNWPFQSIAYSIGSSATRNTRLAWGTNFGFLGQSAYLVHGSASYGGPLPDATAPGRPFKSYSTYIVLGPHSAAPVEAQVAQVERIRSLVAQVSVGSVAMNGPSGVGAGSPTMTYPTPGYDPVRGAITYIASANRVDANIGGFTGTLANPLVIVRNYTGSATPQVRLGDTTLVADVDYFASRRSSPDELWLTLNRGLSGNTNRLRIDP